MKIANGARMKKLLENMNNTKEIIKLRKYRNRNRSMQTERTSSHDRISGKYFKCCASTKSFNRKQDSLDEAYDSYCQVIDTLVSRL